jgi:hypothetical protein
MRVEITLDLPTNTVAEVLPVVVKVLEALSSVQLETREIEVRAEVN